MPSTRHQPNLEALTILMPVHDSGLFLSRWIRYSDSFGIPVKILLLPKTEADWYEVKQVCDSIPVRFLELEICFRNGGESLPRRLEMGAAAAVTEFVAFASDDDFLELENYSKLVSKLEKNPLLAGARGSAVSFITHRPNWTGRSPCYSREIEFRIRLGNPGSVGSNPLDRVKNFLMFAESNDLWLNWYSVFRKQMFIMTTNEIQSTYGLDPLFWEIFLSVGMLAKGDIAIVNAVTYFRQEGTSRYSKGLRKTFMKERSLSSPPTQSLWGPTLTLVLPRMTKKEVCELSEAIKALLMEIKVAHNPLPRRRSGPLRKWLKYFLFVGLSSEVTATASARSWSKLMGFAPLNFSQSLRRAALHIGRSSRLRVWVRLDSSRYAAHGR